MRMSIYARAFMRHLATLGSTLFPKKSRERPSEAYTLRQTLSGPTERTTFMTWSSTNDILASVSKDGNIYLWGGKTGELLHILQGHKGPVWSIIWSPNGQLLASNNIDGSLQIWDGGTGKLLYTLSDSTDLSWCVAWSPDERFLLSGSLDGKVRLWDKATGNLAYTFHVHKDPVIAIVWAPNGQLFASGALDNTICIWSVVTGTIIHKLFGHTEPIKSLTWSVDGRVLTSLSLDDTIRRWNVDTGIQINTVENVPSSSVNEWSPDGKTLASSFPDHTIRLWDTETGHQIYTLEGHTGPISYLSFSSDGKRLTSFSFSTNQVSQGTIRVWEWNTTSWRLISVTPNIPELSYIAFHSEQPIFAAPDIDSTNILIWGRDNAKYSGEQLLEEAIYYANAKVVLVGDSGVGKSGLGLVLSGKNFELTESTHGRHIWTLQEKKIYRDGLCVEVREILLWDLAGQPGYRLIHQLHLNEVTIALVVFDARSETDPFAGVHHWDRALRQAQCLQQPSISLSRKFLVAARTDRGGAGVSSKRIELLMQDLGFHSYFETSAKEGIQIKELRMAIESSIAWEELPKVSSTQLFQVMKNFLIEEKKGGRLLETADTLYRLFLVSKNAPAKTDELRSQFDTCIGRLESAGLIKRLSFGNLVLLQPELLDAYASALVNAVRDEPDGLGSIMEEQVRTGNFRMPADERLADREQEKLLLITMAEDLLQRELVLREEPYLVFPAQSTRMPPDLTEPEEKSVIFTFDGPINNIYATLAVRLANSSIFKKKDLWRNAVIYTASVGGECGIFLQTNGDGHGELSLFFSNTANEQTRFHFEEYIQLHLQRKAIPDSIKRKRIFSCDMCNTMITDQMVKKRTERGFTSLNCPVCGAEINLLDKEKRIASLVQTMDRAADKQRDRETVKSVIQGKRQSQDYDVFFCYNSEDELAVKKYATKLLERGILPWLEDWEIQPGRPKQRALEAQIKLSRSAAVFVGKTGIGPWTQMQAEALLRQFVERNCSVIPVLLPESLEIPALPLFLDGLTWVDFHKQEPDPFEQLLWGITGEKPV